MLTVLTVLAVLCVLYAVVMFLHKGPLPCFHYLVFNKEERAAVRTPKEYRNAGVTMLLFAAACLIARPVEYAFPGWLIKYVVVLAACAALYFFTYDLKPKKWEDLPESKIPKGGSNNII